MKNFAYVLACVFFTVYGQLIVKWQVTMSGAFPASFSKRVMFLLGLVLNPWVISSVVAAFLAFLCWVVAMTKFQLSYAYPFMSLAFVLVLLLSAILFHEAMTPTKVLGVVLVIAGIILGSRG